MSKKHIFAVGFITYAPGDSFFSRLNEVSSQGICVYVFDNTPNLEWKTETPSSVKYMTAGRNVGLGFGLSVLCSTAHHDGYPYLIFFDQDTAFTTETLNFINEFIETHTGAAINENAAVVFESGKTEPVKRFDLRQVDLAISSGSLFVLENLKKMGWHNERYFVDGVDYEFCLRARHAGLGIVKCIDTPGFDHVSEQPDEVFVFCGKKLLFRVYSFSRIKDTLGSYLKLLFASATKFDFKMFYQFARSMAIYCAGQIISRIIYRKF